MFLLSESQIRNYLKNVPKEYHEEVRYQISIMRAFILQNNTDYKNFHCRKIMDLILMKIMNGDFVKKNKI